MKPCGFLYRLAALGCLICVLTGSLIASEPAAETATIHRVRDGETLDRICWQYKVRAEFIQAANPGLTEPLTPGQRLVIPLGPGPGTPADPPLASATIAPIPRMAPVAAVRPITPRVRPAIRLPEPVAAPTPTPIVMVARAVNQPAPPPAPVVQPPDAEMPAPPERERNREALAIAPPEVHHADFSAAARELAEHKLRYNERWTPPGEREAWVMDCSNTSRYLYRTVAGIDIGRTASDQYYFLRQKNRAWDVPTGWDHLPRLDYLRKHLEPGDLLFWENTYKPVRHPDITHVMIYLGEDANGRWQMAGSQASAGVSIYHFDPQATKGGYSSWFGLVHHEGRFVAYGRPS